MFHVGFNEGKIRVEAKEAGPETVVQSQNITDAKVAGMEKVGGTGNIREQTLFSV